RSGTETIKARSGNAKRSATSSEMSACGRDCSYCARAIRNRGESHSICCSVASAWATAASSLGKRANEPVAKSRDRRRRERVAEHRAEQLARLADDVFPLPRQIRVLDEQRAAFVRRPGNHSIEARHLRAALEQLDARA